MTSEQSVPVSQESQPTHQAELLANFALTRQALDDFIESRSPLEREAARVGDDWTAYEVLGLVGFWMDYTVERMTCYAQGDEPPRDVDFDALNQRALDVYAAHRNVAWSVAVISATSALARLTAAVGSSGEALLTTYNYYGDETGGGPFFGEIQANGFTWPMQELEKYYRRTGDEQRAQAIRATLIQVIGPEEPTIVVPLTEPCAVGALAPAPLIVDVRGASEYAAGHAQGAVNIPLDQLADRLRELPQETPIITYCNMNHPGHSRGERAAALLSARGFAASALVGGLPAWQAAGLPVEVGEQRMRIDKRPTAPNPGQPQHA